MFIFWYTYCWPSTVKSIDGCLTVTKKRIPMNINRRRMLARVNHSMRQQNVLHSIEAKKKDEVEHIRCKRIRVDGQRYGHGWMVFSLTLKSIFESNFFSWLLNFNLAYIVRWPLLLVLFSACTHKNI